MMIEIESRLKRIGFSNPIEVAGRFSLADLFPKSKSRCGIYLLQFADGLFYIGQAVDIVRRFGQHHQVHKNIVGFDFQPITRNDLDDYERDLIHKAEAMDVPLTNRVHAANIVGDTDLDMVLSPSEQDEWLSDSTKFRSEIIRVNPSLDEKSRFRFKHRFEKFQTRPEFQLVTELLRRYIQETIPAFRRTEFSFWSVSCLPATNANTFPRLVCVNANWMEIFVVGYHKKTLNKYWGFINIAAEPFRKRYKTNVEFRLKFPGTIVRQTDYAAAGTDQLHIEFDLSQAGKLL